MFYHYPRLWLLRKTCEFNLNHEVNQVLESCLFFDPSLKLKVYRNKSVCLRVDIQNNLANKYVRSSTLLLIINDKVLLMHLI